jgi:hypothetical protein
MYPLTRPGRPGEFVLLAAERTVTVTREEHHQDVLAGRSGPAVAELRPCRITAGRYAGQDGLEVALDGRRVGELTRLMAQRYRPMVDDVQARGCRAGCEALLRDDTRGVQVELRLPAVTDDRVSEPPTDRLAVPPHLGAPPPTAVVPGQRRRPPVTTVPVANPPVTRRRRSRRVLGLVTGAVVGVLVLASALGNGARDEVPVGGSATPPSAVAAPAVIDTGPATTSAAAAVEPVNEPEVAATRRSTAQARPPATSKPATNKSTTSKPAPRTVQAAPKPAPEPKSSGCDPNYDGCVPIARDVDCEGGSGDGPAYVKGPVRVIGTDIYGLDRGGEPGVGCE